MPPSNTSSSSNKKSNKDADKEREPPKEKDSKKQPINIIEDYQYVEQTPPKRHNVNDFDEEEDQHAKSYKSSSVAKSNAKLNSQREVSNKKGKNINTKESFTNNKEDVIPRLVLPRLVTLITIPVVLYGLQGPFLLTWIYSMVK